MRARSRRRCGRSDLPPRALTSRTGSRPLETAHDGAEAMTSRPRMDAKRCAPVVRAYGRYRRFDAAERTTHVRRERRKNVRPGARRPRRVRAGLPRVAEAVRDCAMLDNAATAVDLDDLFSSVDAGEVGYGRAQPRRAGGARRQAPNSATRSWSTRSSRFCFANVPSAGTSRNTHKKTPARPRPASNPRSRRNRKTDAPDAAYAALAPRDDILPRAQGGMMNSDEQRTHSPLVTKRDARDDQYVLESLLGRAALNAFRAHDASLRRVYAHLRDA